jgi:glyoxalase superfamily protein
MPLVTFQALCFDANDVSAVQGLWAETLGLELQQLKDGDAHLRGTKPGEEVWINAVPEPRTVKQRVHLDVRAESLEPFTSRFEQLTGTGEFSWTTFADPEGGEFCVFTYDEPPAQKFKSIVIDSTDHVAISDWWAGVIGGKVSHDDGYSPLEEVPGLSNEGFDFVPVPEPKTVKNRIHWDVTLLEGATVDDLVTAGATVLVPEGHRTWTVMADPEGNEFCVFANE